MPKESFMLVSLKEDKAKKLAQVMANPTCTRILDYLAGKDATESQIAKDLSIPLSTVHYNLQQLVDAKLVLAEEFHYSEKGREVNHYKLANKYIIIAPQEEDENFLAQLKKYLPAAIITAGLAVVLKTMQFLTGTASAADTFAMQSAEAPLADAVPEAAPSIAQAGGEEAVRMMKATAPDAATTMAAPVLEPSAPWWQSPLLDYFIAGAFFVLIVIVIIEAINHVRRQRK